jgi:hypothetical protein
VKGKVARFPVTSALRMKLAVQVFDGEAGRSAAKASKPVWNSGAWCPHAGLPFCDACPGVWLHPAPIPQLADVFRTDRTTARSSGCGTIVESSPCGTIPADAGLIAFGNAGNCVPEEGSQLTRENDLRE